MKKKISAQLFGEAHSLRNNNEIRLERLIEGPVTMGLPPGLTTPKKLHE